MIGSSPEELDSVVIRADDADEPEDKLKDDGGEFDNDEDKVVPETCTRASLAGLPW